jgi:hypothetical protein
MTRKSALLGLASLALAGSPALADGSGAYGYRYNTSVRADGVDWTGLYSGMHSGGVTGKTTFVRLTYDPCPAAVGPLGPLCAPINTYRAASVARAQPFEVDIEGFHVGPHIGYQRQFGNLVLGADLGFSVGGGEGEADCTGPFAPASYRQILVTA